MSSSSNSPPCRCSVFMATSQDGFIADKDNKVDWLNELQASHPLPEGDDGGFQKFMDSTDAIVMGRTTYETVLGFVESGIPWPYGSKPLYVLSHQPQTISIPIDLVGNSVKAISGDPSEVLTKVTADVRGSDTSKSTNIYVDGGRCIRSFMDADLVTAAVITKVPVTLGQGVPLFSSEDQAKKLQELNSITLANGFVQTTYSVL